MADLLAPILLGALLAIIIVVAISKAQKRHAVDELKALEKKRLKTKKEIEHVRYLFFKRQIGEEIATKRIAELEEELRIVEDSISRVIKGVKRLPDVEMSATAEMDFEKDEEKWDTMEAKQAGYQLDSKFIYAGVALFALVIAITFVSTGQEEKIEDIASLLTIDGHCIPDAGSFPGGSAGIWVSVSNPTKRSFKGIVVSAKTPEDSGLLIQKKQGGDVIEAQFGYQHISEFEAGGERNVYFPVKVLERAMEGTYNIELAVEGQDDSRKTAAAQLKIVKGLLARESNRITDITY